MKGTRDLNGQKKTTKPRYGRKEGSNVGLFLGLDFFLTKVAMEELLVFLATSWDFGVRMHREWKLDPPNFRGELGEQSHAYEMSPCFPYFSSGLHICACIRRRNARKWIPHDSSAAADLCFDARRS